MSAFNEAYLGEPQDAITVLENCGDLGPSESNKLTRVALINALRRIDQLEKQVAPLRKDLNP